LGLNVKNEIPGVAFIDAGPVTLCLSELLAKASGHIAGATEIVFPSGVFAKRTALFKQNKLDS
jgi:hypothetical protein